MRDGVLHRPHSNSGRLRQRVCRGSVTWKHFSAVHEGACQ